MSKLEKSTRLLVGIFFGGGIVGFFISRLFSPTPADMESELGFWGVIGIISFFMMFIGALIGAVGGMMMARRGEYRQKSHSYAWIWLFLYAGWIFFHSFQIWFQHQATGKWSAWQSIAVFLAVFVYGAWFEKKARGLTWSEALVSGSFFGMAGIPTRDERDVRLIERATRLGFVFGSLLLFAGAVIFTFVPVPQSNESLFSLFMGLLALQLAFRNFIAWKLGLK